MERQLEQNLSLKSLIKAKKYRFLGIITTVLCLCLTWGQLRSQITQASEVNSINSRTEIASTWQYASFPVDNFQSYTSPFGYRISPTSGKKQFHRGIDMAAPMGSYIRNWWTGKVIGVSDHTACGTMVKIQSGRWKHVYCHMMGHIERNDNGIYLIDREGGIQIWQGQEIPVGAPIGRVGMTGRTTGPHLHWGLMYDNAYIDPAGVLKAMNKIKA